MTQKYDTSTIEWTNGIVGHASEAFPIERVPTTNGECWAFEDRPGSIPALLDAAIEHAPGRDAVIYPAYDRIDTYNELDQRINRVAAGLSDAGVNKGDIVSVLLTNRPAFVETFFACAKLGAVAAPINTRVSARELSYVLNDAEPAILVTEVEFLSLLADTDYEIGDTNLFVADGVESDPGRQYEDLFGEVDTASTPEIEEHDPCALLYTSGTTGQPKGCHISHFNIVNGAINYHVSFGTEKGLCTLVTVPLFHGAGLVSNLLHTVAATGTTVVKDGVSPNEFLATIETHRIEFTLAVPTTYILAMEQGSPDEYDLSSFDIAVYGGAPMPSESVHRLREAFTDIDLCDAYGTTETTAGLVTMCPDKYTDDYAETIGLPSPPVEVAVVDENHNPLGSDEVGELAIRGPIVISEYHNRPEATAEAFADGWHYTGDLATINEEGFVELKGRSKDKIVRGGENIYVLDIEEVLTSHEKVLETSVTGFPDAVLGERVMAAVVPKPEVRVTEDELRAHCIQQLADYKRPEIFRILDELPKNSSGKVIKSDLLPEPLKHGIQAGSD